MLAELVERTAELAMVLPREAEQRAAADEESKSVLMGLGLGGFRHG